MDDNEGSVLDSDDDDDSDNNSAEVDKAVCCGKSMLVDLMGHDDNAESDPLVHLDGIEEKPDDDNQMNGTFKIILSVSPLTFLLTLDEAFQKKCTITSPRMIS